MKNWQTSAQYTPCSTLDNTVDMMQARRICSRTCQLFEPHYNSKVPNNRPDTLALYPNITLALRQQDVRYDECKWTVRANPDGTLKDMKTRKEYPYLFWEADSDDGRVVRSFNLDGTPSFCVPGNKAGMYLFIQRRLAS